MYSRGNMLGEERSEYIWDGLGLGERTLGKAYLGT